MYLYTKAAGEICMNKFIVDGRYAELLNYYGIRVEEALRKAELPGDTFCHKAPVMKEEAYYRFMDAAGALIIDPQIPIQIACTDQIESFSPPIFASYCSKNGNVCIERLARYKKLIGPMVFQVQKEDGHTEVVLTTETAKYELPQFLVETEFVFLVGIIRKATKETITPIAVNMKKPVTDTAFSNFWDVRQCLRNMMALYFWILIWRYLLSVITNLCGIISSRSCRGGLRNWI